MRIAIIADIHGNLPAPEAVLADIARHEVDCTINLGDCVSGPLWPREVCDLLMARQDLSIRGNHDRWVSGTDPLRMGASDRYATHNSTRTIADFRQRGSWRSRLPRHTDRRQSVSHR
jgi:predicted phosphodiesterase